MLQLARDFTLYVPAEMFNAKAAAHTTKSKITTPRAKRVLRLPLLQI